MTVTYDACTPAVVAMEFWRPCFTFGSLMKASTSATVITILPTMRFAGVVAGGGAGSGDGCAGVGAGDLSITIPVVRPKWRTSPLSVTGETIRRTELTPDGS